MAAPKLNEEQRKALLTWLSADYSEALIRKWFEKNRWEMIDPSALTYYRKKWSADIDSARTERHASAINSGLALKEERVKRLAAHADELEAIKWEPDDKGLFRNEKSWRETLDDIAKEMGHRRTGVDVDIIDKERAALLEQLRNNLSPEVYAQIAAALMAGISTGSA